MNIRERFQKLLGDEPEIDGHERWRRAVVRSGNLDWAGLPIDRSPGRPIARRQRPRGYRERVAAFLERAGLKVEQRWNHIPTLLPDEFDRSAAMTERAYDRRFDQKQDRDYKSVAELLQDGCAAPPKK